MHPSMRVEARDSNVALRHTVLVVTKIGKSDMQFIIVNVSKESPVNAHFWRNIRALKSKTDKKCVVTIAASPDSRGGVTRRVWRQW